MCFIGPSNEGHTIFLWNSRHALLSNAIEVRRGNFSFLLICVVIKKNKNVKPNFLNHVESSSF